MIDCILDYLGAHTPALHTYDNRPLIAISAIPSNKNNIEWRIKHKEYKKEPRKARREKWRTFVQEADE